MYVCNLLLFGCLFWNIPNIAVVLHRGVGDVGKGPSKSGSRPRSDREVGGLGAKERGTPPSPSPADSAEEWSSIPGTCHNLKKEELDEN